MTPRSSDLLRIAVACSGAYGALWSLSGTIDVAIARILLLFAACSTAIVAVMLDSRSRDVLGSMLSVGAWCFLAFGIGYVPVWYLQDTYTQGPSTRATTSATTQAATSPPPTTREVSVVTAVVVATSLPTVLPIALDIPTPAAECGQAVIRGVAELVIRDKPGLATRVIGSRPQGTTVEVRCDPPVEADGISWSRVRTAGVEGWMSSRFLKEQ